MTSRRLPIDLLQLTEPELVELNHKIVERLRFLRDAKAHHHMQDLHAGDRVSFFSSERGQKITGIVLRLNRKSVSLVDSDGVHWRVAPAFLTRIETQDVEVEAFTRPNNAAPPTQLGLRLAPLAANAPRNAPCPCGSGKKHKRCCLGQTSLEFR